MIKKGIFLMILTLSSFAIQAQVKWMRFEQLDSALKVNPKPVFVTFYTDWCTYCKKMEQEVFTNSEIINQLNSDYYALRFDAESSDIVYFDGLVFKRLQESRFHQLAMTLAAQKGQFTPPALIFLNQDFELRERVFSYQSRKQLLKKLNRNN